MVSSSIPFWAALAAVLSMAAVIFLTALATRRTPAYILTIALLLIAARLGAGLYTFDEPNLAAIIFGRFSAPAAAILMAMAVNYLYNSRRSPYLNAVILVSTIWLILATLLDQPGPVATLPLDLTAFFITLPCAIAAMGEGDHLLGLGMGLVALRSIAHPLLRFFAPELGPTLYPAAVIWIIPAIATVRTLFAKLTGELSHNRRLAASASGELSQAALKSAGIAHDLKNLLQAIVAGTESLADPGRSDTGTLEAIKAAAKRGSGLAGSIAGDTRGAAKEQLNLNELLCTATAVISPSLGERVSIKQTQHGMVPAFCNRREIEQVIGNLILNSAESGEGKVSITISCSSTPEGRAHVVVEDDGPGIPQEVAARIFDPDFSTKARGSGLGLANAKTLMEKNLGTIAVFPAARGARFELTLPTKTPPTILIVDPDSAFAKALAERLEAAGLQTVTATDGSTVLSLLERGDPGFALVVTELVMAQTGGRALLEKFSKMENRPGLFVVSTVANEATKTGALEAGADLFLEKPCDPASVVRSVLGWLDK